MTESPNAQASSEDFEFEALSMADNYRAALMREFSGPLRGNVLEVGAGIGQFTEELLKKPGVTRLVSIEPHVPFCNQLIKNFPGHSIIQGTINDLKDDGDWNAIVNINVLEHIQDDEGELKNYHERLRKNHGILCLFVPARPELYSLLDKDFGHFRRYTRPELRQKLERAGFEIVRLRYYNIVGYLAWWLMFRVLRKRHFNPRSVRFFDRFIFPSVHGFESHVFPPFIGQNLLAMARAK
ncbi:MAG TPA: class I SAM-dependent methyltransferase [Candidatus Acidoferrum sp.]|nr:class I SAM-dependent methyltransferase [Candidatus Acidoferrum sp.]